MIVEIFEEAVGGGDHFKPVAFLDKDGIINFGEGALNPRGYFRREPVPAQKIKKYIVFVDRSGGDEHGGFRGFAVKEETFPLKKC